MDKEPIHVMLVLTDHNIGGAGRAAVNLIRYMNRQQFEISVAVPANSSMIKELQVFNIPVYQLPHIEDRSFSLRGTVQFFKLLRKIKPDLIHTHASLSARLAAKLLGIKVVFTRHWVGNTKVSRFAARLNNWLCDGAIGVSEAAAASLCRTGIHQEKISVVYNGVEPLKKYGLEEKSLARQQFCFPADAVVIGTAARLEEVKGHKYLLEAIAELMPDKPHIFVALAGEGSLKEYLEKMAKDLGLADKVQFLGHVKDMAAFYNSIDFHVLPSLEEAFPLSLLEAMSVACPCIGTNSGGTPEIIKDGETGLLVPAKDSGALVAALRKMMDDKELALSLGGKALQNVNKNFTPEMMAKNTEKVYRRVTHAI